MTSTQFALSPESTKVWDQIVAPKYALHERPLVRVANLHSEQRWHQLPHADFAIDVGFGFGDTTRRLANTCREVIGVECSELFVRLAKERYAGTRNLEFETADIAAYTPPRRADLVFSRFGLMFFERPVQALKVIRNMMMPGVPLHTLVWSSRDENPWLNLARSAVLEHVPAVESGAPSCGPGPFSMANPESTRAMFEAAGFSQVQMHHQQAQVNLGSVDEAANLQLALGPAGEIMRHAEQQGHSGVRAARCAVRDALSPFLTEEGVFLNSSTWWLEARA